MSLSQFYVLSSRGDTVLFRDCMFYTFYLIIEIDRQDLPKNTPETFFRKVKFWQGDPPPFFVYYNCIYISINRI